MSRRTEMLGSTIQRVLALLIQRELSDPRITGMPTITRVKVSPDLSIADIYMTIMGTPGQQSAALSALRHSAGLLRTKLTQHLTLRVAPYLKFHMDENLKKELAILDALRQVAEENAELDRQRAEKSAEGEASPSEASPDAASPAAEDSSADDATGDDSPQRKGP